MSLQDLQIATAFFTLILVCLVFVSGNHQRVGEPLQASCGAVSSNVAPPLFVFLRYYQGDVSIHKLRLFLRFPICLRITQFVQSAFNFAEHVRTRFNNLERSGVRNPANFRDLCWGHLFKYVVINVIVNCGVFVAYLLFAFWR